MTCQQSAPAVDVSPPAWLRSAVGYQVFVRSFADADGDGFGDLRGLIGKLDHLNDGRPGGDDLEVDLLYLMPLHPASSYHGYDVTDYCAVSPELGSLDDLRTLLAEAHKRGMRVVMDLVLNHSSSAHPWFVSSASGPEDPKRNWYVWRGDDPGWARP
ncbi:MAG: alpha-amylase, partial [Deltaproteobacteria bacterium]|nr:alpha-amylase [Deltaproteobacteria bacterium]